MMMCADGTSWVQPILGDHGGATAILGYYLSYFVYLVTTCPGNNLPTYQEIIMLRGCDLAPRAHSHHHGHMHGVPPTWAADRSPMHFGSRVGESPIWFAQVVGSLGPEWFARI